MKSVVSSLVLAILAFFCALNVINAAPVHLAKRDVYAPPVLEPNSMTIWKIGTNQTVRWDVSDPPELITSKRAKIILVKDGILDFDHPLAENLDVLAGHAQIEVSKTVVPGDDYQIIVYGDSGNTGDVFRIVA